MLKELFEKYDSSIKKRGISYELFETKDRQLLSLQYSNSSEDNAQTDDIVLVIRTEDD